MVEWVKNQFGLRTNVLRPVPEYSMNPLYWLGALTAITFGLQVVTGLLMLIYYVPTVGQAYASTQYIIQYVPLGQLLESIHLYGAYAMILLALLHLFRGYFASVQKSPRQMMWVVGMLMGLTVMGFGLTGYLLPWTVVSKSATDVSIGMISFLPAQIGPIITFLIAGDGSSAGELTRFFDLHIIVLPAALLSLLALKMYLFEAHGAATPPSGSATSSKEVPWFPTVYLYFAMLGCVFMAVIIAAASIFPISLPVQFSAAAASNYVPQPEWYFLWMYQILKFASFEGQGIYVALGLVTLILVGLALLPFVDRGSERNPRSRPLYVTVGLIAVAELVVLTIWGYLTPGQVIPDASALAVLGTTALAVGLVGVYVFRSQVLGGKNHLWGKFLKVLATPLANRWTTSAFLVLLGLASVCFANVAGSLTIGVALSPGFTFNLVALLVSFYMMLRILKNLDMRQRRQRNANR
jgi:ubiquinol-cytochrome c reductase cytochrome b subunit